MKAEYYTVNDSLTVVLAEDGTFYAYDSNERWNGEYYKGWKSSKFGYEIEEGTWNIKPIYEPVGEPDKMGEYEQYEEVGYEIWQSWRTRMA